ncbi:hypothetical protein ACFFQF_31750 [Haladaptatus pallidirubidus]|uniref:Uncharacterized protein n=1 Tax=Haladaptatus pallidirubidus TaxID=1008152 RepID=A0AAV3UQ62_9EURY|nr:hypothetical protein [Haladaptatus pallidirubidus]
MSDYNLGDFFNEDELDHRKLEEIIESDERTREELVSASLDSEGSRIFNEIRSLYSTLNMVNTNFTLLTKKRDEFVAHDATFWMKKSDEEMQDFFREYLRRLHNYTASVHTLISHTYTFLDRHEDDKPGLKSGYFEEIRSRDLQTKVNLLKQIRHYTQKNWIPPLSANISTSMKGDKDGELELFLDKEEMLEWNGWDSDVQIFLESLDEEIVITKLAEDYQKEMNDFYDWFRTFILSIFYDEILEFFTASLILQKKRTR